MRRLPYVLVGQLSLPDTRSYLLLHTCSLTDSMTSTKLREENKIVHIRLPQCQCRSITKMFFSPYNYAIQSTNLAVDLTHGAFTFVKLSSRCLLFFMKNWNYDDLMNVFFYILSLFSDKNPLWADALAAWQLSLPHCQIAWCSSVSRGQAGDLP